MYDGDNIARLARQVHEASLDSQGWGVFLKDLAATLNGTAPTFFWHDPQSHTGSLMLYLDWDSTFVDSYRNYYAGRNVWLRGGPHLLTPGTVRTSHMMCSRRVLVASEWYATVCRQLQISQGIGATLLKEGEATANIGIFAGDERPDFDQQDIRVMKALLPDMRTALSVHRMLSASEARRRELEATLEGLPHGVLLVTRGGCVTYMNSAAGALVTAADGVLLEGRCLKALRGADTTWLHALIAAAAGGREMPAGAGPFRVARLHEAAPLEVTVAPMPMSAAPAGHWVGRERAVAAVYLRVPRAAAPDPARILPWLIRTCRLTEAEAEVAMLIAQGHSPKETAAKRDVAYNTIRTQLRSIYEKTGTSGQPDLVRLVLGYGGNAEARS